VSVARLFPRGAPAASFEDVRAFTEPRFRAPPVGKRGGDGDEVHLARTRDGVWDV
jgi:hypothetical protein